MRRAVLVVAVLLGMALTACSNQAGGTPSASRSVTLPPTSTSAAPTSSIAAGPSKNERGNLVKALGQQAGFADPNGNPQISFAIDKITVDPKCDQAYSDHTPQNGHLVRLDMRASTTSDLTGLDGFNFATRDFHYIGPDGITHATADSVASYSCLNRNETLPDSPLGPSQQYVGALVLDVQGTSGAIVYAPPYLDPSSASGWEWDF